MMQIIDNGKPTIETGLVQMFGRLVLVTELDEPQYLFHPINKTVQIMYFAVTETKSQGFDMIGELPMDSTLRTWLWDGWMAQ